MNDLRIFITVLVIMTSALLFLAFDPNTDNIDANEEDNFENSEYYLSKLDEGYHSAELYYNLGNAFFSEGKYPHAKLYYEKAIKLSPFNGDIRHNLSIVNRSLDSDIIAIPDFFLVRWWRIFLNIFHADIWAIISIISAFSVLILLALKWFFKPKIKTTWPIFATLVFIFSFTVSYCSQNYQYRSNWAILMYDSKLLSGPSKHSTVIYELQSGEKLHITDSLENWFHVVLMNKEKAWIVKNHIEKI